MHKNKCKICLTSWETLTPVKRCKNCGRSLTGLKSYKYDDKGELIDKNRIIVVDNVDKKVDKLSKARNVFREDDDES